MSLEVVVNYRWLCSVFAVLSGRMSREQLVHVMMSMSSAGGESLQEIWKMLDEEGVSPRITPLNTVEGIVAQPLLYD